MHRRAGLNRKPPSLRAFVGAGAGTDVQHAASLRAQPEHASRSSDRSDGGARTCGCDARSSPEDEPQL
jgi:hypothetical protein